MHDSDVAQALHKLREQLASEHKDNSKVLADTVDAVKSLADKIDRVERAFPGADFEGHMRYHDALVKKEEQRQKIRQEIITHLAKVGTWAALIGTLGFLFKVLKEHIFTLIRSVA